MKRVWLIAIAAVLAGTGWAAADGIEGRWRTDSGGTTVITPCGDAFCITVKGGKHDGKRIGRMKAKGDSRYSGEITDPETDKTYSGRAQLAGDGLNMKGCVLGGLICKGQNWKRM